MKHLLIIEDHPTTAMITEEIFSSIITGLEITVAEGIYALSALDPFQVDLVVADLLLPDAEPQEVIKQVSARFPLAHRVYFSSINHPEIQAQIEASGGLYVSKSAQYADILERVQQFLGVDAINLQAIRDRNEFQSLIQMPGSPKPLTIKQAQVMEQILLGLTGKEIAKQLQMSPDTVNAHIKEAFGRLGAQSRGEAVFNYLKARNLAWRLHGKTILAELYPEDCISR
ncbi:MAG TPA: response regulator transcription factor [Limnobacter sp.]|nr:response regulator transcription factor [Limnobacter sp.]